MIYIISSKKNSLKFSPALGKKDTWVELLPQLPKGYKAQSGDQIYIDNSGQTPANLKKTIGQLKKSGAFWGIIDPKGTAADPALFFFDGASDYICPAIAKKGLGKKRFEKAISLSKTKEAKTDTVIKKKCPKLPASKFEGWKSIRSGTTGQFIFLFVSISKKSNIHGLLGETGFSLFMGHMREVLQQTFAEANPLLWMEAEGSSLLLIPPRVPNGKKAVEAALKMIMNGQLIGIEKLGLSLKTEFTIVMHYGQTIFQAPGKTGTIISEPVNYIFHLGNKKAETGRLTISEDVPAEVIPDELQDLFVSAGVFENIPITQSKRFLQNKKQ